MVLGFGLQADPVPLGTDWWQGLAAIAIVLALLAALVYAARRGTLGGLVRGKGGPMAVESVLPLGDRRSLVIVTVEGRRLLLGASPVGVALVTELAPRGDFGETLARATTTPRENPR